MRQCTTCKQMRDDDEFYFRSRLLGIRDTTCKQCKREYQRDRFEKNHIEIKQKTTESKLQGIANARDFVNHYLAERTCKECGEYRPQYLTFHHVRGKKRATISEMVAGGYSIDEIMKEILKCEVLCYNHHMALHERLRQETITRKKPDPNKEDQWYHDHGEYPRWYLEQEERNAEYKSALDHDRELRRQIEERYEEERRRLKR